MESRRQARLDPKRRGMSRKLPPLPNLDDLIDGDGQITIGAVKPVQCAAIATYARQPLAMLVRRDGETFIDLLTRLDAAVAIANEEEAIVDEINTGPDPRL